MARVISLNKYGSNAMGGGVQISRLILIENLETHPTFENLYSIDPDRLDRIAENMKITGYDSTKPVDVWKVTDDDGTEHLYLIDGYTRRKAAIKAGLEAISYNEHTEFKNEDEALKYAIHVQVDRRNLEPIDLLKNIERLMNSDYIKSFEGNKNTEIGRLLGISSKTVQRNKFILDNATDEQIEQIAHKQITTNALNNEIKKDKFISENADDEQLEQIESGELTKDELYENLKETSSTKKTSKKKQYKSDDEVDDLSDALDDNSGNPVGLSFNHHEERPYVKPGTEDSDSQTDRLVMEVRKARIEECSRSFLLGVYFSISEIIKGSDENTSIRKVAKEIVNFDLIKNFSSVNLNFEMPEDDILILNSIGIKTEQIKSLKSV